VHQITTSDAVAVVSAQRFGHDDVLAQILADVRTETEAADLAAQLGELTAAVNGVILALAGHGDASLGLRPPPDPGGVAELASIAVRCAAEGDRAGVEVVCLEASAEGVLESLLRQMAADVNRALADVDRLPGPEADSVLARLGLAAARQGS
jgi:hypothetical protein